MRSSVTWMFFVIGIGILISIPSTVVVIASPPNIPRISDTCLCVNVPAIVRCPNGFTRFGGKCFRFFQMSVSWLSAKAYCEAVHAELVSLDNWRESQFLIGHIRQHQDSYPGSFWTAGNNLGNSGDWRWAGVLNAQIKNYENWYPGNPDGGGRGGEHCLELERSYRYRWNDQPCDMPNHFICQMRLVARPAVRSRGRVEQQQQQYQAQRRQSPSQQTWAN